MTKDMISADKFSARRARILLAVSVIYITQQLAYFGQPHGDRAVDGFRVLGWVLLSVVILGVLLTNGNWMLSEKMRHILDDEVTQMHRAKAIRIALVTGILGAFAIYAFAPSLNWEIRTTVHAIISIAMSAGLVSLGVQEWRSNRDG